MTMKEEGTLSEKPDNLISDGQTVVRLVNEKMMKQKIKLNKPLLIAGFPGPGFIGSICTSYIIEQLSMHQIAYVDSDFISPGVIYIGGKLRHPFRLYSNNEGNVCVLVCDAPIRISGIRSVLNTVLRWSVNSGVQEVIVVDGIGIEGIPESDREPVVLLSNPKDADDCNYLKYMEANDEGNNKKKDHSAKYDGRRQIGAAFIGGISGGLLASCLSNCIACRGLLIPSTPGIPDPEGSAIVIEKIGNMGYNTLKIDVQQLRLKGEHLKRNLENVMKGFRNQQQQEQDQSPADNRMYG